MRDRSQAGRSVIIGLSVALTCIILLQAPAVLAAPADLSILDISISDTTPTHGDKVTISLEVVNRGGENATGVAVQFLVDGKAQGSVVTTDVAPGESSLVTSSFTADKDMNDFSAEVNHGNQTLIPDTQGMVVNQPLSDMLMWPILISLSALGLVLVIFLWLSRRKKGKSKGRSARRRQVE